MHFLRAVLFALPWLLLLGLYTFWHWQARGCYPAHLVADCCIVALALVCGWVVGACQEASRWRPRVQAWRRQVQEALMKNRQDGERAA